MTSERIASSLARPPALRTTWASPSLKPALLRGIEPSVHAGEDGELSCGRQSKLALRTERRSVLLVSGQDFIENGHRGLFLSEVAGGADPAPLLYSEKLLQKAK